MDEKMKLLPLELAGMGKDWKSGLGSVTFSVKQKLEVETRANFVRSCGDGRKLDPVLAWHLGVGSERPR